MDILLKKLYAIKKEPNIYIGRKSVYLLRAYIDGYIDRMMEINPDFKSVYFGYYDYIREQYKMAPNFYWDRILTAYSSTDDKAFELFYSYLDKYLESKDVDISIL